MAEGRLVLGIAAAAIGFAAADTYVVVMALPQMMTSAGLSVDELQRAAPIVSGFLLGYVGVLPLIGRISDLHGRVPVLFGSLVVFVLGSVITASGYDLSSIVVGRFLQGVGGGGLIPPTLALIADLWPAERRGVPLGVVGAVQELGSVLGPLLGAAVLARGTWHDIFWVNAVVGALLATALWLTGDRGLPRDRVAVGLLATAAVCLLLVLESPDVLTTGITTGLAFLPVWGTSRWLTPLALVGYGTLALFAIRWRGWRACRDITAQTDVLGAVALSVALAAVIVTFASADPEHSAVSKDAVWLLPVAIAALVGFVWRQRTASHPLVPRGAMSQRPAWGSLVVSFLIGGALIAAVVDVPVYARSTRYTVDQFGAALVLLRFLLGVPFGAICGGWLLRRWSAPAITAVALSISAVGFWVMSRWDAHALDSLLLPSVVLFLTGLGFGLAIAPVNEALLNHTDDNVHGIASALVVVARMVGMLIGISALTAIGLRAFEQASERIPPMDQVCSGSTTVCRAYTEKIQAAGIEQTSSIFLTAAVVCVTAAVAAAVLVRRSPRRVATVTS